MSLKSKSNETLTEDQQILKIHSFINMKFFIMTLLYEHYRVKNNSNDN